MVADSSGDLTKVWNYGIFGNMRRTTFHPGPLDTVMDSLAQRWGLRPGAGPGEGHAAIIRLSLRVVAHSRPDVEVPRSLHRLPAGKARRHTIFLEAVDDAAISKIREWYDLPSAAAAIRVALWLVEQLGLAVVPPSLEPDISKIPTKSEEVNDVF